jgi:phytoene dehydrogenase-like protein
MCALLASLGGEIVTGAEVTKVAITGGRATGVELAGGEHRLASRAVIANLTPGALYGRLVALEVLPPAFRRRIERYRYAPGTMMVHLALDDLPRWSAGESARRSAYVHLGPYLDDMSLAYQRAMAGLLPERPTLVVGQPTAFDPSRAPEGKHILWVQVRVLPARIRGDAAGEITATEWDEVKEPYADRVIDLVDGYASGLRELVLARHVMSPLDLERANPNLVGGDQLGGSMHPAQNFFLRPIPGWSRHRTPVDALYVCGAGTWPGAGVGAGSGYLLGKQLTRKRRLRVPGRASPGA